MIVDAIRERGDDALAVKVDCADLGGWASGSASMDGARH